jgi:hypothetical protein
MKKADVLQLTMVLIGIVLGFSALQNLFSSLYITFIWLFTGTSNTANYLNLTIFAVVGLQVICSWLLITRSDKLAKWFYRKSELGTGFKIITKPNDLLHILLIVIGIFLLISNLGPLLKVIIEAFKTRASRGILETFEEERPVAWLSLIFDILLPLMLLMFAKPIADYFAKKIGEEPIGIEESIEGTEISETNEK